MAGFSFPGGVIRGSEVLKFSDQKQVNNYIMFQIYQDWNGHASQFSHPWFDFTEPEVQDALRKFMNIVSKFVRIRRDDFRPLVEKAVYNTLRLTLNPEEAFLKFFFLSNDKIPVPIYGKHAPYFADFDFAIQAIQRYLEKNAVKVLERDIFFEKFRKVIQIFEQKEGKSIKTYQAFLFKRLTGRELAEVIEHTESAPTPIQPQSRFNRQPGPQPESQQPALREPLEKKAPQFPTPKVEPPKVDMPKQPIQPDKPVELKPPIPPVVPAAEPKFPKVPEPIAQPVEPPVAKAEPEEPKAQEPESAIAETNSEPEVPAAILPEADAFEKGADEPTLTVSFEIEPSTQEAEAEMIEAVEEPQSEPVAETQDLSNELPDDAWDEKAWETDEDGSDEVADEKEDATDFILEQDSESAEESEPETGILTSTFDEPDAEFDESESPNEEEALDTEEEDDELTFSEDEGMQDGEDAEDEVEEEEEDEVWIPQPEEMWEPDMKEQPKVEPSVSPQITPSSQSSTLFPNENLNTPEKDKPQTLSEKLAQGNEKKPALHELLAGRKEKSVLERSMEQKSAETTPINPQPPVSPPVHLPKVEAPEPPKVIAPEPPKVVAPEPPKVEEKPDSQPEEKPFEFGTNEPDAFDLFEKTDAPATVNSSQEAGTTLADRFRENSGNSLNEQMKRMQSIELEHIPVHKQFQFVQKLFGGSSVKFKVVLDKVNETQNRSEAGELLQKYVFNNPDVNPDTKIAQEFRDLVNRRFGN